MSDLTLSIHRNKPVVALLDRAVRTFGARAQRRMFFEEAAEALAVVAQHERGRDDATFDRVVEELADTFITGLQVAIIAGEEAGLSDVQAMFALDHKLKTGLRRLRSKLEHYDDGADARAVNDLVFREVASLSRAELREELVAVRLERLRTAERVAAMPDADCIELRRGERLLFRAPLDTPVAAARLEELSSFMMSPAACELTDVEQLERLVELTQRGGYGSTVVSAVQSALHAARIDAYGREAAAELGAAPPLPGDVLANFITARGMTPTLFAERSGLDGNAIVAIIDGEAPIGLEEADRIAKTLGTSKGYWVELQAAHDVHQTRRVLAERWESRSGEVAIIDENPALSLEEHEQHLASVEPIQVNKELLADDTTQSS